jgi:hypothetical protein
LLEAIRNLDTPLEDGLDELAPEIVTRRLGLSSTVAAQIERYRQRAERGDGVPRDEVLSVLRLVGRRSDAALAFADAGRRVARYATRLHRAPGPTLLKVSPAAVSRRLGSRAVGRLARRVFGAELLQRDGAPEIRLNEELPIAALPGGEACGFYGAAFGELLRGLTGFEGAMIHEQCRARGDDACLWRTAAAEVYQ